MKRILSLTFLCWAVSIASATEFVWNGAGDTNTWSTAENWVGGALPPLSNANITLQGFSRLNSVVNTPWSLNKLTFAANAGSFTLMGSRLSISGGIDVLSANPQTIENDIRLLATQTWNTQGDLEVMGQITGNGTLSKDGNGTLVLSGTTANLNTDGFNANAGTTVLSKTPGANAIAGNLSINNSAIVQLDANEQIANNSDVTISTSGSLNLNGKQETIGSIAGSGTVSLGRGRLTIAGNKDTTFAGSITGSGGLTQDGTATTTLTGINSYTGNTIVSSGTLRLGGNNRLADTSGLILAGGTFDTNGFSQNMGILTLTSDSTINLGSGSSILGFSNSASIGWQSNANLTISNWNGSLTGNGTDQITFGASGLNNAQLGQIKFFNPAGLAPGIYDAVLLANGEIVPVPEPATIGLGALLLGMIGAHRRKQRMAKTQTK